MLESLALLQCRHLVNVLKVYLYFIIWMCYAFLIAIYGCESWTTKKAEKTKIASFENWCWRRMVRVSWTDKRTNASIDKEIKRSELS